jgi:hypothetical protein
MTSDMLFRAPLLTVFLPLIACSKSVPEQRTQPSTTVQPTSIVSATQVPTLLPGAGLPFGERFLAEAQARPKSGITVEAVHAAWKKAGVVLTEEQQHLAAPFEAKYCVGGKIGTEIATSVCEYTDAKSAEGGKATSMKAFGVVKNREILVNGSTTLTVRINELTAVNQAVAKKMKDTFVALK